MRRLSRRPFLPLQLCDSLQYPFPYPLPVQAPVLEHGVGPLGGLKGGVLAMLADQDGGGAEDVEV